MKARVKATGEIVEVMEEYDLRGKVVQVFYSKEENPHKVYEKEDLDFSIEDKNTPDYWTRLEHQTAIAAMQAIISKQTVEDQVSTISNLCCYIAHTLVEKLKESK